jgi:hypothetical protein
MNAQVQTPNASETADSPSATQSLPEENAGSIPCPPCRIGNQTKPAEAN